MKKVIVVVFAAFLAVAGRAHAEVTSTWTLTSDYDFRGTTQTATDPAIQGSFDYASETGWYGGAWASNVDFGTPDPDVEFDVYGGYSWGTEGGVTYDVGAVYYLYPSESDLNYYEIYAGLAIDWFDAKLWYAPGFGGDIAEDTADAASGFLGVGNDSTDAFYVEANASFALPAEFSLLLHAGYSFGDYWDNTADLRNYFDEIGLGRSFDYDGDYIDYSVGIGYTIGNFDLALKWVDSNADIVSRSDLFNNEGRVILTVETTVPWDRE